MPTYAPGTGLSASAMTFLKKNAKFAYGGGILGAAFVASDVKTIADADNKLVALLKVFKDFILVRVAMVGVFTAVGAAVKTLVRDTGSLNEALKKLTQIQQYSRQFQSFTGSLNSAKQRITELYQLSLRRPFKFEDVVEANRSLEIFTRGAYSSVEATQSIGTAAIASGNNIQDTARAVGSFYDQLRAGKPVEGATEQLRQMGLISQSTADQLTELASSGADTSVVFNKLTDTLEKSKEGAAGYKDDLEAVTQAHANAVDELKRAFGAPWTESDVTITKNQTAAMQAITPVVGRISESMATLYNGFSTATSAIVKFGAQSKIVQAAGEGTAKIIQILTIAAGAFGTIAAAQLIPVLLGYAGAITSSVVPALTSLGVAAGVAETAATGVGVALTGLAVALPVAAIAAFALALGGAAYAFHESQKKLVRGWEDQNKAMAKTTSSIATQISNIKTLTDRNEALTKAIEAQHEAEKDLAKFREEHVPKTVEVHPGIEVPAAPSKEEKKEEKVKEGEVAARRELVELAAKQSNLDSEHLEKLIKAQEGVKIEVEEQKKGAAQRRRSAEAGLQAARTVEESRADIDAQIIQKRKSLELDKADLSERVKKAREAHEGWQKAKAEGKTATEIKKAFEATKEAPPVGEEERRTKVAEFAERKKEISGLEARRLKVGLEPTVPKESATFLEARVEQLQAAKGVKDLKEQIKLLNKEPEKNLSELQKKVAELKVQQLKAQGAQYTPEILGVTKARLEAAQARETPEYIQQQAEQEREARVTEITTRAETKQQELRRRGNIASAQGVQDMLSFTKSFESMRVSLGDQKAASVALAKTQEDIAQEYVPASHIVSSMQAVGGGGEVSQVDPQLDSARRREQLQARMVDLLGILAGQQPEQPSQPTFVQ